jgi:hypothetical protein
MNYCIPSGFNFYEELEKEINKNNESNNESNNQNNTIKNNAIDDTCLIDGSKLIKESFIELNCGHKFNYINLLNDVKEDKYSRSKNYSYYSNAYNKLNDNQLRCPYCRQIQESILPYFPEIIPDKIRYVNYPVYLTMGNYECDYIFKTGKNKASKCGRKCYRKQCHQHYKPTISYDNVERTEESLKKHTMIELRKIAKYHGLKKYSTLKKNDLIKKIVNI